MDAQLSVIRIGAPSLEPQPVGLSILYYPEHQPHLTVITRQWKPGDPPRCRLCRPGQCCATRGGVCTILVGQVVPPEAAASYRNG